MGVFSDGSYGTTEGVMFSFPVQIANHKWTIVQGLELDDFAKDKLALTGKELCEEREEAMAVCSAWGYLFNLNQQFIFLKITNDNIYFFQVRRHPCESWP